MTPENREDAVGRDLACYIKSIVFLTWGFEPKVGIYLRREGFLDIYLDGTIDHRKIMVGKEGKTIDSLKYLVRAFSRRQGFLSDLFVEYEKDTIKIEG